MKNDYRKKLYHTYASDSRQQNAILDLNKKFRWFDHKIQPLLKVGKDATILELGCGQGHFLAYLKDRGYQNAKGIDISEEQILIAKELGVNAETADVFDFLDQDDEGYDMVIAFDFLEHFSKEELFELLPKIYSRLKPDGVFISQTPNGMGLFPGQVIYGDLTHTTILNPYSLEQLMTKHHFTQIRFYETGPLATGLKGRMRVVLWNLIRRTAWLIRKIETGKSQTIWTENVICCCSKPSTDQSFKPLD